jgi:hypothetical protein
LESGNSLGLECLVANHECVRRKARLNRLVDGVGQREKRDEEREGRETKKKTVKSLAARGLSSRARAKLAHKLPKTWAGLTIWQDTRVLEG